MKSNVSRSPDVGPKILWTSIADLTSLLSFDRLLIATLREDGADTQRKLPRSRPGSREACWRGFRLIP